MTSQSISNCLNLADRLYDKFVLRKSVKRSLLPSRVPVLKLRRKRTSRPKYGKHNPMPAEVRARIIAKLRQGGAERMSYAVIGRSESCSAKAVNDIAHSVGIVRGQGNWRKAA